MILSFLILKQVQNEKNERLLFFNEIENRSSTPLCLFSLRSSVLECV